jgi:hypothetical protein
MTNGAEKENEKDGMAPPCRYTNIGTVYPGPYALSDQRETCDPHLE